MGLDRLLGTSRLEHSLHFLFLFPHLLSLPHPYPPAPRSMILLHHHRKSLMGCFHKWAQKRLYREDYRLVPNTVYPQAASDCIAPTPQSICPTPISPLYRREWAERALYTGGMGVGIKFRGRIGLVARGAEQASSW